MYTLVVVDMQPYFSAANSRSVIKNCKREIEAAMLKRAAIIIVEFNNCGPSVKSLLNLVDGYDRLHFAHKDTDDGSAEVEKIIKDEGLAAKQLKVCGVNTDCCVQSTVRGLTARLPNATIEVIGDACNSDFNHLVGLDRMKKMANVSIKNA